MDALGWTGGGTENENGGDPLRLKVLGSVLRLLKKFKIFKGTTYATLQFFKIKAIPIHFLYFYF